MSGKHLNITIDEDGCIDEDDLDLIGFVRTIVTDYPVTEKGLQQLLEGLQRQLREQKKTKKEVAKALGEEIRTTRGFIELTLEKLDDVREGGALPFDDEEEGDDGSSK